MNLRRVVLAAVLAAGLCATHAYAQNVVCGGATVYYDWACHYTPRIGWHWELEVVGSRQCYCGWDHCPLLDRETSCSKWSYLNSCPPANATCTDHGDVCNLPAPHPSECTGPVPPGDREGWALHDGTAGTYTPDPRFSYNSTGSPNEVTHWSTGYHRVEFPGLGGRDGNVQVVAYGTSSARCKVDGWGGMPDLTVHVRCHGPAGQAVDTPFLVYFFATDDPATGTREIGHARYDWSDPLLPPDPAFQWNSNGPLPTTARLDAGSYAVRFRNLLHTDGAAVVTALGRGPEFCQVSSIGRYSAGADSGLEIRVSCYDTGGRLADSSFTLRYEWQRPVAGAQAREGYAFAHHATAAWYSPTPQFNSAGQANLAARLGSGTYALTYPGLPAPEAGPDPRPETRASTVLLSAQALNPSYCKVVSWGGSDAQTTVNARCFNNAGALTDRTYQEMYLTRRPLEPPNNP